MSFKTRLMLLFCGCLLAVASGCAAPQVPISTPVASPTATALPAPQAVDLGILGNGTAETAVWSADGKLLAVGGSRGIYLYETASWKADKFIPLAKKEYGDGVRQLFFHPDGKNLFYTSIANHKTGIYRYELVSGQTTQLYPQIELSTLSTLSLSPDGQMLATLERVESAESPTGYVEQLTLRQVSDGAVLQILATNLPAVTQDGYQVAFSPDSHKVAVGGEDNQVHVWETASGKLLYERSHEANIQAISFSPDGKLLVSSGDDGSARFWDSQTGESRHIQRGFTMGLVYLAYALNGRELLLGLPDNSFQLWALDEQHLPVKQLETSIRLEVPLYTEVPSWRSVKKYLSPDGQQMAVINLNNLQIWDLASGQLKTNLPEFNAYLSSIEFSPDGKLLALVDQNVHLWQVETRQALGVLTVNHDKVSAVAFHPNGKQIALATGHVQVWDIARLEKTMDLDEIFFSSVAYSPDGELLAAGGWKETWVLDTKTGRPIRKFASGLGNPKTLGFSADGKQLIFIAELGLRVWELASGKQLQATDWKAGLFDNAWLYSPANAVYAQNNCTERGRLLFLDTITGKQQYNWKVPGCGADSLAIHPDQRLLAFTDSFNDEANLYINEMPSGQTLFTTHLSQGTESLRFNPGGSLLAGIDTTDKAVQLWDISNLARLAETAPQQTATPQPEASATPTATTAPARDIPAPRVTPAAPAQGALTASNAGQIARLGQLGAVPSYSSPQVAAWSPDSQLFSLGALRSVLVYRLGDQQPWRVFYTEETIQALVFSPDRHLLAAVAGQGNIIVWELESEREIYHFSHDMCWTAALAFSADGKNFSATCSGKSYWLDLESGQVTEGAAQAVPGKISPDGLWTVSVGYDYFYLRSAKDGSILHTFENGQPWQAGFSPTGNLLFLCYSSGSIEKSESDTALGELWQVTPDQPPVLRQTILLGKAFNEFPDFPHPFQFSTDGQRLVTSTWGDIRIWDPGSGKLIDSLKGGEQVYLSPDNRLLLNISWSGLVQLWNISPGHQAALRQELGGFFGLGYYPWPMFFVADGKAILTGNNKQLQRWDLAANTARAQTPALFDLENIIQAFAASSDRYATAESDGSIALRDPKSGKISKKLIRPPESLLDNEYGNQITRLSFSNFGTRLASASGSTVWIWDLETGALITRISPSETIDDLFFSPDGQMLVVSSRYEQSVEVWETATGKQLRKIDEIGGQSAFAPDGLTLAVGNTDGKISLLDLRTGYRLREMQANATIYDLAMSPDGSILVAATADGLEFWDPASGQRLKLMPEKMISVLFSPDGRLLVGSDARAVLRVWGLPQKK